MSINILQPNSTIFIIFVFYTFYVATCPSLIPEIICYIMYILLTSSTCVKINVNNNNNKISIGINLFTGYE